MLPRFLELFLTFQNFWNTISKRSFMNPITIINYIKEHKITKEQFCKMCDITIDTLDGIIYYGQTINFKTAERIAKRMDMGVYELYSF